MFAHQTRIEEQWMIHLWIAETHLRTEFMTTAPKADDLRAFIKNVGDPRLRNQFLVAISKAPPIITLPEDQPWVLSFGGRDGLRHALTVEYGHVLVDLQPCRTPIRPT